MALHLPHHRQAVDAVGPPGAPDCAHIFDLLFLQPLLLGGRIGRALFLCHGFSPFGFFAFFLPFSLPCRARQYAAAKIS